MLVALGPATTAAREQSQPRGCRGRSRPLGRERFCGLTAGPLGTITGFGLRRDTRTPPRKAPGRGTHANQETLGVRRTHGSRRERVGMRRRQRRRRTERLRQRKLERRLERRRRAPGPERHLGKQRRGQRWFERHRKRGDAAAAAGAPLRRPDDGRSAAWATGSKGDFLQGMGYSGYAFVFRTPRPPAAESGSKACGTSVGCLETGFFCGSGNDPGVKNGGVTYGAGFGADLGQMLLMREAGAPVESGVDEGGGGEAARTEEGGIGKLAAEAGGGTGGTARPRTCPSRSREPASCTDS